MIQTLQSHIKIYKPTTISGIWNIRALFAGRETFALSHVATQTFALNWNWNWETKYTRIEVNSYKIKSVCWLLHKINLLIT